MSENVQVCTRCVMDNIGDSSIVFYPDGTCNYCNEAIKRKDIEYFPNELGRKKLDEMFSEIKAQGKGEKYDCMVGVSGGLDSSYIIYLGWQYGLRILAVHIDDGFDTDIAVNNIQSLCNKANVELVNYKPEPSQYMDLVRAFFRASVPNFAIPQDNILLKSLSNLSSEHKIYYSLKGGNFAFESILQRGTIANAADKRHILAIHKKFGELPIDKLPLISMPERYLVQHYLGKSKILNPLNFIDYDFNRTINDLSDFCGYKYYGGKHWESVLTRFLQCYYLPVKYNVDKRKSHYSSMIISGQLSRENALEMLKQSDYTKEMQEHDFDVFANAFEMSRSDFCAMVDLPAKQHTDYPVSRLTAFAGTARRFRKYLGS